MDQCFPAATILYRTIFRRCFSPGLFSGHFCFSLGFSRFSQAFLRNVLGIIFSIQYSTGLNPSVSGSCSLTLHTIALPKRFLGAHYHFLLCLRACIAWWRCTQVQSGARRCCFAVPLRQSTRSASTPLSLTLGERSS